MEIRILYRDVEAGTRSVVNPISLSLIPAITSAAYLSQAARPIALAENGSCAMRGASINLQDKNLAGEKLRTGMLMINPITPSSRAQAFSFGGLSSCCDVRTQRGRRASAHALSPEWCPRDRRAP